MTDHYAVIGNPINHTKSPLIHGLFAQTTGQDMVYTALLGTPGAFAQEVVCATRDFLIIANNRSVL